MIGQEYLSLDDLAAYSGLSRRTLQRHLAAATDPLPHLKIGGRVVVRRSVFDQWIDRVGGQSVDQGDQDLHDRVTRAVDAIRGRSH